MARTSRPHRTVSSRSRWRRPPILGLAALLIWPLLVVIPQSAAAASGSISIIARDLGSGAQLTEFTWLINEDNALDPQDLPSLNPTPSHSPVVAAGNAATASNVELADGKYLITVRAPGHKLWGKHIRMPDDAGEVALDLISDPLPLAQIQVKVFKDDGPVNGADDIPLEDGLAGFNVIVKDPAGEVTVDWFGNPICTEYDSRGNPIADSGGECVTNDNGEVVIKNMPPGKYEIRAIPPDGTNWIQTSTIEGTPGIDAWVYEGDEGFAAEEGFRAAPAAGFGFVQPMAFPGDAGTGSVSGVAKNSVEWVPPTLVGVTSEPIKRPWVALTDIGQTDRQVYTGRGNLDGSFTIPNVPAGTYQLAVWDEPLDYIITFQTVTVGDGEHVDMGTVAVPRWFGWQSGSVFIDANANMLRDEGEAGVAGVDLAIRFRDGSLKYGAFTDHNGYYEFPEIFPFGKFLVSEVGFGRFGRTGASAWQPDEQPAYDDGTKSVSTHDGALTLNTLTYFGKRNIVDWGKVPYQVGENGGISGLVLYATTRNETDARLQAAEDYEPGIPGVTMRLWGLGPDGEPNTGDEVLLNEVETDAWEHPTDCDYLDRTGSPIDDPLSLGPNCTESVNISNEVKDGVFDGGYAFETMWEPAYGVEGAVEVPLPQGDYEVQAVVPFGYQIVKEEDVNTAEGDDFVPAVAPPPCSGDLHAVPPDDDSPYAGQERPLCDRRLVALDNGANAAADFYLFIDNDAADNAAADDETPVPGRVYGLVFDDLAVETDNTKLNYGEQAGVANIPIGIRDFTGRLLTTVTTDENGAFDVLLPSSYTANAPIPSGVAPGMYRFVTNDKGDPGNPNANYNPAYSTLNFTFDVWPGKTTIADLAIIRRGVPDVDCSQPGTPELHSVSQPWVSSTARSVSITGANFGADTGQVILDGQPVTIDGWADTSIGVTVPTTVTPGPHQLQIARADGAVTESGITIHVLGPRYNLNVRNVYPGPGTPLQSALNSANPNTLIVVNAGSYRENVVVDRLTRVQGVGPGEPKTGDGGAVIDAGFFPSHADAWEARVGGVNAGPAEPPSGSGLTIAGVGTQGPNSPLVDGMRFTGAGTGADGPAVWAGNTRDLTISNNLFVGNGGLRGGVIALGEPYVGDNNNLNTKIVRNRIVHNGGTLLAGAVGIFTGADNYEVAYNQLCGNYSAEYGGAISHLGKSPGGRIHHNDVMFNGSFDEGGGIMVGGEPVPAGTLGTGSGDVTIDANHIEGNNANDDGGGIRLLAPLADRIAITNNMVVNNVSTDYGGGIALDDASNVVIANNTIANNNSTATSVDSDGLAHAAGLSSTKHSAAFLATLPADAPQFSDPVLFNNIFWGNQAYTWDGTQLVAGELIDLEVIGTTEPALLNPRYSLLSVPYAGGVGNQVGVDPQFAAEYDNVLTATRFFLEPDFITIVISVELLPPPQARDYHIGSGSPAVDAGTGGVDGVTAPSTDFDGDPRPTGTGVDVGADEVVVTP